jgi:UDP-N-acetylglucosamine--N-acetylmuramyl-(pentapeptide) pyrophosphoryl-undecaprenol N-acetylglucosamine transferase
MRTLLDSARSRLQGSASLRRLLITGGGSGGHLIPGLALAERARECFPDLEVIFFRTRRPVEGQVFAEADRAITVRELELCAPGRSPLSAARFLKGCFRSTLEVRAELRRSSTDLVVALGGYPSLPGILAALRERTPLLLLEQNLTPGRVVKRFARWADAIACPVGAAPRIGPHAGRRTILVETGTPLRRTVLLAREGRAARGPAAEGPASQGRRTVLVVGGSQGARAINRALMASLPVLGAFRERISWIHLTGNADKEAVEEAYRKEGWDARVYGYTSHLPLLFAGSDLVLSRAGGATVSELAAIGVPSALVPYPHHRDRHQEENALSLARAGAARLIPEEELGPESLASLFQEVLFDPVRLRAMEAAALALGRPQAADHVLELIARVVSSRMAATSLSSPGTIQRPPPPEWAAILPAAEPAAAGPAPLAAVPEGPLERP